MNDSLKPTEVNFSNQFDKIMDPSTQSNLQILHLMDDSLSISFYDLLKYFQFSNYSIKQEDLQKIIASSLHYYYEEKTSQLKLKKKCERRIIVFPSFEFFNEKNFIEEIQNLFKNFESHEKIKKIEKLNSGIIFVFFDNEDDTKQVFNKLEDYKMKHNLNFNANIKSENLKRNLLDKAGEYYQNDKQLTSKHVLATTSNYYANTLASVKPLKENLFYDIKRAKTEQLVNSKDQLKLNPYNIYDNSKNYNYDFQRKSKNNKFDLVDSLDNNENYNSPFYKENYNSFSKNYKDKKKSKLSYNLPLNKDYNIKLEEEEEVPKQEIKKTITYKYQVLDFAKIFFNLNLLFKTDKPLSFEGKFISEVMRNSPRKKLDLHKNKEKHMRERAQTFFESGRKSPNSKGNTGYSNVDINTNANDDFTKNRRTSLNLNI